VFPEGIRIDTVSRHYLTSKVNVFLCKACIYKRYRGNKRTSGDTNKKLPIKSDEESSLVAGIDEISNFDLLKGLADITDFLDITDIQ